MALMTAAPRSAVSAPPRRAAPPPGLARRFALERAPASASGLDAGMERARRLGHRFAPPAAAPPAAAPAAQTQPVQPLMETEQLRELTPRGTGWFGSLARYNQHPQLWNIESSLNAFHAVRGDDEAATHQRLRHLHDIEHATYAWHEAHRPSGDADAPHPFGNGMTTLLHDVQQEHQRQIAHSIANDHSLWVPGRERMTDDQRGEVDTLWNRIVNPGAHDNLRVHQRSVPGPADQAGEDVAGFTNRVHAMHARLMTTAGGRNLLNDVVTGPQVVDVRPNHPLAPNQEPSVDNPAGSDATALTDATAPMGAVTAGTGAQTPLTVNLTHHMSDTDFAMLDSGFDHLGGSGRYSLAPAFLTYGHELGHAAHNQRGTNRHALATARYDQQQHFQWHDAEEEHNITRVENPLRREHGLTARQWHRAGPGNVFGQVQPIPARRRAWYWWT